jgi:hypothetical protein
MAKLQTAKIDARKLRRKKEILRIELDFNRRS